MVVTQAEQNQESNGPAPRTCQCGQASAPLSEAREKVPCACPVSLVFSYSAESFLLWHKY